MRYTPEQDRVLFLFSTQEQTEYRVWLTRRFTTLLWKALMNLTGAMPELGAGYEPKVRNAILGVQHQESVQNLDVSQPHDAQGDNTAYTEQALLVIGCTSRIGEGGDNLTLELKTLEGPAICFFLNKEILHSMFHLLQQVTTESGWELNLQVGSTNVVVPDSGQQLH